MDTNTLREHVAEAMADANVEPGYWRHLNERSTHGPDWQINERREKTCEVYRTAADAAIDVIQRSELSVDQSTPFRWSPAHTLAARSVQHVPGWMDPHWVVLQVGPADWRHHVGQRLTDQHVAGWSPLVRKGPSNVV